MPSIQTDDVGRYLIAIGFLDAAGGLKRIPVALTSDLVLVTGVHPSASVYTNRGATGPVTLTLPPPSFETAGTSYELLGVEAQDMIVMVGDVPLPAVTKGQHVMLFCDGVEWIAWVDSTNPIATVEAPPLAKKKHDEHAGRRGGHEK
jgi:hypothetical protein